MAEDDNQKSIKVGLLDSTRDEPSSPTFSNGPPPSFTVTPVTGGQNNHTLTKVDLTSTDLVNFDNEEVIPVVDLPPPPDGGWGWVICFASFMCNLVLDGIAYTFGVLLEPLVEYFGSDRSTVSWAGSLLAGVYLTSGPIVGGLVNKFGCRPVCIAGGVVSSVGLALSVLSPNVGVLMLTYGVIGGFGLGLIYLPAVVAVGYYFEKRRALATGISVCGSGVGTFLFAPLSTALLNAVDWKAANLVFAGLCLMCGLFGALMKPLELTAAIEEDEEGEVEGEQDKLMSVQLPDGSTTKIRSDSTTGLESGDASSLPVGGPSITIPPSLPTITELSITAAHTSSDRHKSIKEVFPEEDEANQDDTEEDKTPTVSNAKRHSRVRTTSTESPNKFSVKPVVNATKRGSCGAADSAMTRNCSAPHFLVVDSSNFPRNLSTPGFGRMARLSAQFSSTSGSQDGQVAFGHVAGGQRHSGAGSGLILQPGSRRDSTKNNRPIVRPMYRKDVFYTGSSKHLAISTANTTEMQNGGAPHLTTRPSQVQMSTRGSMCHGSSALFNVQSSAGMSHVQSTAGGMSNVGSIPMFFDPNGVGPNGGAEAYLRNNSIISIPKFYVSRNNSIAALSIPRDSVVASHLELPKHLLKDSEVFEHDEEGEVGGGHPKSRPLLSVVEEMLSISLLLNPAFLLIAVSNLLGMLGFYVPFVFLPNMAAQTGISKENANFLLSIIGISNTLGRVLSGWFTDFSWVNSLMLNNFAILMSGVCVALFTLCQDYASFVTLSAVFGFFVATYISLTSIVLVDLLGLDKLTSAFGLLVLFRGLGSIIGTPLGGALYDASLDEETGERSYTLPFLLAGGFLVVASLISSSIHVLQFREAKKQKYIKDKNTAVTVDKL